MGNCFPAVYCHSFQIVQVARHHIKAYYNPLCSSDLILSFISPLEFYKSFNLRDLLVGTRSERLLDMLVVQTRAIFPPPLNTPPRAGKEIEPASCVWAGRSLRKEKVLFPASPAVVPVTPTLLSFQMKQSQGTWPSVSLFSDLTEVTSLMSPGKGCQNLSVNQTEN